MYPKYVILNIALNMSELLSLQYLFKNIFNMIPQYFFGNLVKNTFLQYLYVPIVIWKVPICFSDNLFKLYYHIYTEL